MKDLSPKQAEELYQKLKTGLYEGSDSRHQLRDILYQEGMTALGVSTPREVDLWLVQYSKISSPETRSISREGTDSQTNPIRPRFSKSSPAKHYHIRGQLPTKRIAEPEISGYDLEKTLSNPNLPADLRDILQCIAQNR